jgi:hypothetical protein
MYTKDLPHEENLNRVHRYLDKASGALIGTEAALTEKSPSKNI